MTVAELEAALTGAGYTLLGAADPFGTEGTYTKYTQRVGRVAGDVYEVMGVSYITDDSDPVNAYWLGADPLVESQQAAFVAWLQSHVDDGTFEGFFIEWMNEVQQNAVVKIVTNALQEKRFFIDRDGTNAIRYREIVTV